MRTIDADELKGTLICWQHKATESMSEEGASVFNTVINWVIEEIDDQVERSATE